MEVAARGGVGDVEWLAGGWEDEWGGGVEDDAAEDGLVLTGGGAEANLHGEGALVRELEGRALAEDEGHGRMLTGEEEEILAFGRILDGALNDGGELAFEGDGGIRHRVLEHGGDGGFQLGEILAEREGSGEERLDDGGVRLGAGDDAFEGEWT